MCEGDSAASLLNTSFLAMSGFSLHVGKYIHTDNILAMRLPTCILEGGCGIMQDLDLPILLLGSQRLAVLRYDAGLHRYSDCIVQLHTYQIICWPDLMTDVPIYDDFIGLTGRFTNVISVNLQAAGVA